MLTGISKHFGRKRENASCKKCKSEGRKAEGKAGKKGNCKEDCTAAVAGGDAPKICFCMASLPRGGGKRSNPLLSPLLFLFQHEALCQPKPSGTGAPTPKSCRFCNAFRGCFMARGEGAPVPSALGQKQGRRTLAKTELPRKQPSCPMKPSRFRQHLWSPRTKHRHPFPFLGPDPALGQTHPQPSS